MASGVPKPGEVKSHPSPLVLRAAATAADHRVDPRTPAIPGTDQDRLVAEEGADLLHRLCSALQVPVFLTALSRRIMDAVPRSRLAVGELGQGEVRRQLGHTRPRQILKGAASLELR